MNKEGKSRESRGKIREKAKHVRPVEGCKATAEMGGKEGEAQGGVVTEQGFHAQTRHYDKRMPSIPLSTGIIAARFGREQQYLPEV